MIWCIEFLNIVIILGTMGDMGDEGGGDDVSDGLDPAMMGEGGPGGGGGILLPGNMNRAKLASQSIVAIQELGMVIGVAFLVGILFMLMIYLEKLWTSVIDRLSGMCGRTKKDEENPADLVGTFKRYKN
jgi:hypothetical protein